MHRLLFILAVLFLPASAFAATTSATTENTFVVASSSPGNSYAVGTSVILTTPIVGDFSAFGGSVVTASPIKGDGLILAGSISSRSSVAGDVRLFGGNIDIIESIGGDLVALGFAVHDSGRAKGSVFIIAMNTTLSNGAAGPVTIYGNNISLAGEFAEDVVLFAGGHVTLAPGTVIHGKFSYEAPDTATIPASVTLKKGVTYTNASYLPDIGTSRILAFLSIGFFLVARIIGELILAGLFAGLFPRFAETMVDRTLQMRLRNILLTLLLGFAILIATPIVIMLLLLTFVGMGLALLLLTLYMLLLLLALMYAGILIGSLLVRRFLSRERVLWHDGVLGMLVLSLSMLVPFVGPPILLLLILFSAGILLQMFYHFAFAPDSSTPNIL